MIVAMAYFEGYVVRGSYELSMQAVVTASPLSDWSASSDKQWKRYCWKQSGNHYTEILSNDKVSSCGIVE